MEPITLTLLLGAGLFALKSKSKTSKHSSTSESSKAVGNYPSNLGFKFDCKSIEITNEVRFEKFLEQIVKEAILLPKYANPAMIEFCDFLNYCYDKILIVLNDRIKDVKNKLKCSSSSPDKTMDEKIVNILLKAQITNAYNKIVFDYWSDKAIYVDNGDGSSTYKGILINGELYTLRESQDTIIKPCFEKLRFNYGIDKSKIDKGVFYNTKKYPNPYYDPKETSGFNLICIPNNTVKFTNAGYFTIKNWEKFETYLTNLIGKIAEESQFQDPYTLNLENFIDEYLKRLNSYCSNCFNEGTLTSRMTLIIYVLIQYGLDFYIDNKFGIEDSPPRKKYFEKYFLPAFEKLKLNPKFDYIDNQEVYETEKHMKENEQTSGWV